MEKEFSKTIIDSGYIHRPLKLADDNSFEKKHRNSKVQDEKILFCQQNNTTYSWHHRDQGDSFINDNKEMELLSKTVMPSWPPGAPEDGDYSNFGQVTTYCQLPDLDLQQYNRLYFEVCPSIDGAVNSHIMVSFKNDGVIKVPDIYNREGYHTANLKNNVWNECFLEISDLPRDKIIEVAFSTLLVGQDRATGDTLRYRIRKVTLQKVEDSSISKGWMPKDKDIIYSHNGYHQNNTKIAFVKNAKQDYFELKQANSDKTVFTEKMQEVKRDIGNFLLLDFSKYKKVGKYYLAVDDFKSEVFSIGDYDCRWHDSIWRSLNFIFCERCGCPVPDTHGSCHEDIMASHNGKSIIFNGGWHDAGDLSQQLVQTAEVTLNLFEIAKMVKEKDQQLYLRLLEEGEWGFDFLLKTRFGDGYRATSAGITIWSNGFIGDMDDMHARVHNNAYENFFLAGITANIATIMEDDNRLKAKAIAVAIEDYQFALEQFASVGFKHEPIFWEHTYSTSESLFLATMSWASSKLYEATKNVNYANKAVEYTEALLQCQETTGITLDDGNSMKGFFYRSNKQKIIQHFNHQAREHLYAMALDAIMDTQKEHSNYQNWYESMEMYGEYLVSLTKYTFPYPMIASGLYKDDEALDDESFSKQHLLTDQQAKSDYIKQLQLSKQVANHYYIKKFPVWFSFKGNNAILLSMGKSASVIARRMSYQPLLEIAEGQLQWMVGMNPFNQSLVYGEGYNYGQQYSVLTGEMIGEMPVGVQTFDNEDEPYWPQLNNATYKEVWVGLAGKWMSIVADLYK